MATDHLSAATEGEVAFQLVVSNQSFCTDPVDIHVEIDGRVVVDQDFAVEGQHNWLRFDLVLLPGPHALVATTKRAGPDTR